MKYTLAHIISVAKKNKRIENGLVLCSNCDTPASKSLSIELSWICCAPCVFGEADSFDRKDLITVSPGVAKEGS